MPAMTDIFKSQGHWQLLKGLYPILAFGAQVLLGLSYSDNTKGGSVSLTSPSFILLGLVFSVSADPSLSCTPCLINAYILH